MENKRKPDIQHDSLLKLLFKLSPPAILGMMLISINSLIDAIYVGHFIGAEALAGVSLIMPLSIITTAAISLVSTGAASCLSRAIGKKNQGRQQLVFSTAASLALMVGVLLSLLGYLCADLLVTLMGGGGGAMADYGVRYYRVLISGAVFSVVGVSTNALIRAEGRTKRAMSHLAGALVVNMLMTPTYIHALGNKVEGAALGTVTSMLFYSVLNLHYFLTGKASFQVGRLQLITSWQPYKDILSIGVSGLLVQATQFVRQLVIFRSMAHYGSIYDMAFLGIVFRIFNFSVIPMMGVVQAMQPVTGINFGAKNFQRVMGSIKVFTIAGFLLLLSISLPSLLFPERVLGMMLPHTDFSAENISFFRIVIGCIPFMTFGSTGMTFFQATGQAKIAFYLPLLRNVVIFLPVLLLLPYHLGIKGIYIGICVDNILFSMIVLAIVVFLSKHYHGLYRKNLVLPPINELPGSSSSANR